MTTVTRTWSPSSTSTPAGATRPTVVVRSSLRPAMGMDSVGIEVIAATASSGPRMVTTTGSAVTERTLQPAAGLPPTAGATGTERLADCRPTMMVTWTRSGSMSTGATRSPRASRATRSTSPSTLMPVGSMATRALTVSTCSTSELAPRTAAVCALSTGSTISRPGGTVPRSTVMGTVRVMTGSSRTATRSGVWSRTLMRGSSAMTSTGTETGAPPCTGVRDERSTIAWKSLLEIRPATSAGA